MENLKMCDFIVNPPQKCTREVRVSWLVTMWFYCDQIKVFTCSTLEMHVKMFLS